MYNRHSRNVHLNRLNIMRKSYLRQLIMPTCLLLTSLIFNVTAAFALPVPNFCFAHADSGDTLHTMLFDGTGQQEAPNAAGVADIEAISFNPSNQVLYAVNLGQLGTLNYDFADAANGGTFTPFGPGLGSVNGSAGIVPINDVDSMSFDPITNVLYAVERDDVDPDKLFIIDIATGMADPNGFGTGIGYIVVTDNNPATVWDEDIDDLAINPTDALLYGVANSGGAGDHLITLDLLTGALTDVGLLTTDDMEGLSFFNDGTLYGTTGNQSSAAADQDTLWRINTSNAVATPIATFVDDGDYEAVACLVGDTNNKSGVVFNDANANGTLDAGESPVGGVTIQIYRDTGIVAGAIDASDRRIGTAVTNAGGTYVFDMAAVGDFLLQVDITSLPAGISISDNIEIATFDNCNPNALPFDDFGCAEPNNNFPSVAASVPPVPPAAPTRAPSRDDDPDTVQIATQVSVTDVTITKAVQPENVRIGESITFTLVITNPNAQALPDVTLIDDVPLYFSISNATTTQGTVAITGNRVTANIGTLQPQQTVTVIIIAQGSRIGFAPDTCNQVTVGNGISNQACPNIFPGELPSTGESPLSRVRQLSIFLLLGLAIGVLFRQWRK
jgi:uncharacterized repeat protein (TIGR01451 family)